jgi:uncharacterized protein (DUF488 family)
VDRLLCAERPAVVLTIGHSTRSAAELIALLKANEAEGVMDVRTIPRSRANPQFNGATLQREIEAVGIAYRHAPALGGLRRARPGSPNAGWRNASFRGFADYMQTPEFAGALEALAGEAKEERLALMCAEAVPWRCHRSLIADALTVRGVPVEHILGKGRTQPHVLTPWAVVKGTAIEYPLATALRYESERVRSRQRGGRVNRATSSARRPGAMRRGRSCRS